MNALSRILARFTFLRCLVLALALPVAAHAAGLNDTGITDCSNDTVVDNTTGVESDTGTHPRQDCRYGRDPAAAAGMPKTGAGGKGFDYSKISNDGTVKSESAALGLAATDWACTRDNVTSLVWEVKTVAGLRSRGHTYTWYSSDATINGGSVGTADGGICATSGRCDTEKFVSDVNAAGLCGATDWRMPTIKELNSIVDFGRYNPTLDPAYFANSSGAYFWSSSAYASDLLYAWVVNFGVGQNAEVLKSDYKPVRLVRGTK